MRIPQHATVAVLDGQKLSLFHNTGDEANPSLTAAPVPDINTDNKSGGVGHPSSSANPADSQQDEDGFTAGVAAALNKQAVEGKIKDLIVVAAPRALGELRKHYHPKLKDILAGELSKELTGHTSEEIHKAIAAA